MDVIDFSPKHDVRIRHQDGIAILDRTDRMLFVGDEMMPLRKSLNGSVSKWKADLENDKTMM